MSEIIHVPEPRHQHCEDLDADTLRLGTVAVCDCGARCVVRYFSVGGGTVAGSYWAEEPKADVFEVTVAILFMVVLIAAVIWAVLG